MNALGAFRKLMFTPLCFGLALLSLSLPEAMAEERGTLLLWSDASEGGPPSRDEPLASDRPDFTEASTTVGLGVAQLETGYTYAYDEEGGATLRTHSLPEALLRVGILAEWLEFRIAQNYIEETARGGGPEVRTSGAEDLYLGFKIGLTPQEGLLPEMAIMPQMTVPSGSGETSEGETLLGLNWLYGWDISESISTAGSSQVNRAVDDGTDETYLEFAQSWTVGFSLTERLGAYTEVFALVPSSADTVKNETYFDGGFTFSVSNDLQLDIRGGVGLNDAAADYFTGAGAVFRF